MGERIQALDRIVYRAERAVVVVCLLVMVTVVFLDVVHRTFADPDSAFAEWVVAVARFLGASMAPDAALTRAVTAGVPYGLGLFGVWLAYFGFRSARRTVPLSSRRALAYGVATVLGLWLLVHVAIWVFPHGFVWSQPFALILVLWAGFFGASMCTYENKHLRVEAVQRYLPARIKPALGALSGLLTAAFLVFLAYASLDYVQFHYQEWLETEYKGGMFKGVAVPRWLGFLVLPISFTVMGARFLGAAIRSIRGEEVAEDVVTGMIRAARAPEERS